MLTWLFFTIGFLLTIATAYFSFVEKNKEYIKNKKQSSKTYKGIFVIAIMGGLITFISNINSNYEREESSLIAKRLNDSLLQSQNSLIASQQLNTKLLLEQKDSTNKIISVNNKLYEINSNIQSLQSIAVKNLIGDGNTPCLQIMPTSPSLNYNTLSFWIWNNGDTPIRGLKAYITDNYSDFFATDTIQFIKNSFNYDNEYVKSKLRDKEIFIGDKPPHTNASFYSPKIQNIHSHFSFGVFIQWDNGSYFCNIDGHSQKDKIFPRLKVISAVKENKEIKNPKFISVINNIN
jgi:hypothetical protein